MFFHSDSLFNNMFVWETLRTWDLEFPKTAIG